MPESVGLDASALRALADRVAQVAGDLSAVSIPAVAALPGSALAALEAPRRVTADVRRLGAAVEDWVETARRSVDELMNADDAHADLLR